MDIFDGRYFRVNKLLLSLVGLWPLRPSLKNNIILLCTILTILSVWLPQVAYLFEYARSVDDFYDVLPTLSGVSLCLMKTAGVHRKFEKFKVLVRHLQSDWRRLEDREDIRILTGYAESCRMFTLGYTIFNSISTTIYITTPFTLTILDIVLATNVTRTQILPFPTEFFLDQREYHYVLLGITYVGCATCMVVVLATDTIYFVLLQHACGMLAILSHRLENFAVRNSESKRIDLVSNADREHIVLCIRLQIRVERLIQLIESTFATCLLTDIGLGILFQCSTCVMIVTQMNAAEAMRNLSLLLLQTSRIFLNCFIGQRIIDHSSQMSIAAYNGMWYQTSSQAKMMLLLLLAKCQRPYRITMAKLYVISLEGYSSVMRMSLSYVTLMISLRSDEP